MSELNTRLLPFQFKSIRDSLDYPSDFEVAQPFLTPEYERERAEMVQQIKGMGGTLSKGVRRQMRLYKKSAYGFFRDKMMALGEENIPFKMFPQPIFGKNKLRGQTDTKYEGVYLPIYHLIYVRCEPHLLGIMKAGATLGHEVSHGISTHLFFSNSGKTLHFDGIPGYAGDKTGGAIDNALAIEDSFDFSRSYILTNPTGFAKKWLDHTLYIADKHPSVGEFKDSIYYKGLDDLRPALLQSSCQYKHTFLPTVSVDQLLYFFENLKLSRGMSLMIAFAELDQESIESSSLVELMEYGREVLDRCKIFGYANHINALIKFFSKEERQKILSADDTMTGIHEANELVIQKIKTILHGTTQ